jgi:hypothetical protein
MVHGSLTLPHKITVSDCEKAICLRMFVIKIIYRNSRHFGCCSQQKSQSPCIHSLHTPGFLRILVAIGVCARIPSSASARS